MTSRGASPTGLYRADLPLRLPGHDPRRACRLDHRPNADQLFCTPQPKITKEPMGMHNGGYAFDRISLGVVERDCFRRWAQRVGARVIRQAYSGRGELQQN
jgi:hypothetical protein